MILEDNITTSGILNPFQAQGRDVAMSVSVLESCIERHKRDACAIVRMNHSKEYKNYPTVLYHGYHQRRIGCFAGSRSIYIDSAGDVHSCPFCHTKDYNIIQLIRNGNDAVPQKANTCPQFNKIA